MKTQLHAKAIVYRGAEEDGYKYAFQIEAELDKQFIKERAMARFNGGRGQEFDIHDNIVVNEQ